ncbi:penicillopepsin, putative [Talaromyces stipitatus ATCC 10500]|uniref:Penicillopepsin, putative n=1 Tax=Talaromyces stipitatus (strain ATCC 10500 / CBS 375.48 / QM 6759 / NRRL 1006) TaxID=441959 RepID=B8M028_TALSN|nr:penicillopepsin, putative [Talaromyces stipitatus ATCC 10500]EED20960.1 penicillopepsin, putative [Talaromyces stipitatus ATCC 10500]
MGIIEIGSPAQTIDVQFDTTFNGVLVRSTRENPTDIDGILVYNSSGSRSWGYIYNSIPENTYTQTFEDDAYAIAFAGTETFNIGGKLYSDIAFGQLEQYYPNTSGQAIPFGGTSGIIGLNYNSMQQPLFPSFMYAIQDQLMEWKCSLNSSREWQNGTWILGSLESLDDRAAIAWADRNIDQPTWSVNVSAVSAGSRKNPPISTWSATVSTAEQSLVWPQKLLDWYFSGIDSTWSAFDNTYRYPCNASLPDFIFSIGNGTFTIPGTYMPYQRDPTSTTCISIITGDNSTDSSHEYTFGSWWAQLGVLILDYEHSQVGFMNKSTPLPKFTTAALDIIAMN